MNSGIHSQIPYSFVKRILNMPLGALVFGWGLFAITIAVSALIVGSALNGMNGWSFDEVARVPNPSANVDAVLVQTSGGATTSFGYEIFVLPHGAKPKRDDPSAANLYGAVSSDGTRGVILRWQSDTLIIEYLEAQDASVLANPITFAGRPFQIALKSGIAEQTSTLSTVIKTDKFEGIVCTNFGDWMFRFKHNEFWTPTKDDVLRAEEQIETYFRVEEKAYPRILANLQTYKRQYVGIIVKGHKRIFCNFFCISDKPLSESPVFVFDGGECFFVIEYDLSDSKCYNLSVNGEA